jgi:hypothetical protein
MGRIDRPLQRLHPIGVAHGIDHHHLIGWQVEPGQVGERRALCFIGTNVHPNQPTRFTQCSGAHLNALASPLLTLVGGFEHFAHRAHQPTVVDAAQTLVLDPGQGEGALPVRTFLFQGDELVPVPGNDEVLAQQANFAGAAVLQLGGLEHGIPKFGQGLMQGGAGADAC